MKKTIIVALIILLFLIIKIFYFSSSTEKYIEYAEWRYESGFKIGEGDFMDFTTSKDIFFLKNDTIYYKKTPKAIIVSSNKLFYTLTIKSIDNGNVGKYIDMEGHYKGFW